MSATSGLGLKVCEEIYHRLKQEYLGGFPGMLNASFQLMQVQVKMGNIGGLKLKV